MTEQLELRIPPSGYIIKTLEEGCVAVTVISSFDMNIIYILTLIESYTIYLIESFTIYLISQFNHLPPNFHIGHLIL